VAGANIKVRQGNGEAVLPVEISECVPAGCVRVAAAHASTAALGDLFGTISVERV
jgi:NADH-quinone oxidoreductase subunit G